MSIEGPDEFADPAADPQLARLVRLLNAEPSEHELAGLNSAILEFRDAHAATRSPNSRRRPSMISSLVGAKLGATIAGLAIGLTGAATVAYVSTNTPATPNVHATAAASHTPAAAATTPATPRSAQPSATPVGPDASGPAATGLCTAWQAGVADKGKAMDSVAFRNLAEAAGGTDKIGDYCATIVAPGHSGDHATGQPTAHATGKPATAPTGKPEAVPTGKPSTHPAPPTDRPTVPVTPPTGRP